MHLVVLVNVPVGQNAHAFKFVKSCFEALAKAFQSFYLTPCNVMQKLRV